MLFGCERTILSSPSFSSPFSPHGRCSWLAVVEMNIRRFISLVYIHLLITIDGRSYASASKNRDTEVSSSQSNGRIVQSLFRFPAAQLGPDFNELLDLWYTQWLRIPSNYTKPLPLIDPDASGKHHASHAVSATVSTLFRRQCYGSLSQTQKTLYKNLEQRRKEIEFQYLQDAQEEMKLLHTMVKRFSPAFHLKEGDATQFTADSKHIHKKKAKSTANTVYSLPSSDVDAYDSPTKLAYQTENGTQQWTWRPAGHFSARGSPGNHQFRVNFFNIMRQRLKDVKLEMGRQSGMFWYPPGAVREWHSNYLDLVGSAKKNDNANPSDKAIFASQEWRMYFVRTVRDENFDSKLRKLKSKKLDVNVTIDESTNDHSAMHMIPGDDTGITLEVLQNAGARLLQSNEKNRQFADVFAEGDIPKHRVSTTSSNVTGEEFDRSAVWRIPDADGYVTLFRLPKLWHCIVSEEVHRYSLGFAFSDREVQDLLKMAGVKFDVHGTDCISGECIASDEL